MTTTNKDVIADEVLSRYNTSIIDLILSRLSSTNPN